MTEEEIKRLEAQLDNRTMVLMEREAEIADRIEEIESQKEELTAAIEELVSKNNELIQRNSELDQILYRTSHDLRSPVNSLSGIVNLLEGESLPENCKEYVSHLKGLSGQMDNILYSIGTLNDTILTEVTLNELDTREITQAAIAEVDELLKEYSINISTAFGSKTKFKSDKNLLVVLLQSLLSNSIIYRPSKTGNIQIRWSCEPNLVCLEVEDDGDGIASNIAPRIFDMFFRGSQKSKGMGLGLYQAKKIAEKLNGKIEWSSQPGLTIFKFQIEL
jgi:signal transduction histidine kinase